jgi:leucine dehydrogenase
VVISDLVQAKADALAGELGAEAVDPESVLLADADVVAPCAAGGVITPQVASSLRAWAVCGGANNQLSGAEAERIMARRGILHVPDVIASAGAVIEGVGASIMHLDDRAPLIDALGATAKSILDQARSTGEAATAIAQRMAMDRIKGRRAP